MKSVLIFGRRGQLARALVRLADERGVRAEAIGRAELDLAEDVCGVEAAVQQALLERAPDCVINASGYTAVDRAEDEPEAAYRLNRDAVAAMAHACAAARVALVHVSTDYVFDGRKGAPYVEQNPVRPLGVYGASKAAGELAVAEAGGAAVVLRTSWVYGAEGANFVRTMLRLAADREEVAVVADQRGRPTWARDLADAALAAADALRRGALTDCPVLHVAGDGEATWAEFAQAIFDGSQRRGGPFARVRPITTADYPTRAARPLDTRLDLSRAAERLDWRPRPWRAALSACLDEMARAGALKADI